MMKSTAYRKALIAAILLFVFIPFIVEGASWHYVVNFPRPPRNGEARPDGTAYLWLPPEVPVVRGLLVGGELRIEQEFAVDPVIRDTCTESGLGILFFSPHLSATFHYWEDGNNDEERYLKVLDDLAVISNRPEICRVPWITMGHSTAGIFCRNVAYCWPERTAGVIHIKSGNLFVENHKPEGRSLAGIPFVAMNGQFEVYGPEGGIRPEYGRMTQRFMIQRDMQTLRTRDENHLMSLMIQPGADHFNSAPNFAAYAALFIRKTARYRIPREVPRGTGPVTCIPLSAQDGWLSDPDLENPEYVAAPYGDYLGNKHLAMWHYDRETAEATMNMHVNLSAHQALSAPQVTWLDESDGWTFSVASGFLDSIPLEYGGTAGGAACGHADSPIVYLPRTHHPVIQIAPDRFRLLRFVKTIQIGAFNNGDDTYRSTIRWADVAIPIVEGSEQSIDFPQPPSLSISGTPYRLNAHASSNLPVYYEVDYGPVAIHDGMLIIDEIPEGAQFPIRCCVTAYQIGRRVSPEIMPSEPVRREFKIIK